MIARRYTQFPNVMWMAGGDFFGYDRHFARIGELISPRKGGPIESRAAVLLMNDSEPTAFGEDQLASLDL